MAFWQQDGAGRLTVIDPAGHADVVPWRIDIDDQGLSTQLLDLGFDYGLDRFGLLWGDESREWPQPGGASSSLTATVILAAGKRGPWALELPYGSAWGSASDTSSEAEAGAAGAAVSRDDELKAAAALVEAAIAQGLATLARAREEDRPAVEQSRRVSRGLEVYSPSSVRRPRGGPATLATPDAEERP